MWTNGHLAASCFVGELCPDASTAADVRVPFRANRRSAPLTMCSCVFASLCFAEWPSGGGLVSTTSCSGFVSLCWAPSPCSLGSIGSAVPPRNTLHAMSIPFMICGSGWRPHPPVGALVWCFFAELRGRARATTCGPCYLGMTEGILSMSNCTRCPTTHSPACTSFGRCPLGTGPDIVYVLSSAICVESFGGMQRQREWGQGGGAMLSCKRLLAAHEKVVVMFVHVSRCACGCACACVLVSAFVFPHGAQCRRSHVRFCVMIG